MVSNIYKLGCTATLAVNTVILGLSLSLSLLVAQINLVNT